MATYLFICNSEIDGNLVAITNEDEGVKMGSELIEDLVEK